MHHVSEVMSRDVVDISPSDTIKHAAELMRRYDVSVLPICENHRLVGMVTDRDIAVRAMSEGKSSSTPVREIASENATWCFDDDDLDVVQRRMTAGQVQRMSVVDHQQHLVGALSLDDGKGAIHAGMGTHAPRASLDELADTLEGVSQTRRH
ncbi:CBS domain-containing protein [Paraburkholderia sp.]|uniref:CBS domain-containing protein n=1 Tax=Paraburkholderia sp. TaxID=1926495 RepID=UPI00239FC28E|nr:CBS domain-containing protein [Paraburkholderia sp.]MDE1181708.1 CBS domain-containing protein [Paraburkholderia sp.]